MWDFIARYRHLSLLGVVLLGQLFFLAYQIKTETNVRLLRVWAMAVLAPVEEGVYWAAGGAGSLVDNYLALYDANQENQQLRAQLEAARLKLQRLEARAREANELADLLDLKQTHRSAPLVAAEVIGSNPGATTLTVLVNRGRVDGIRDNNAAITADGVVGKVIAAYPSVSQILLITDQKSGVGAQVAGTHVHGVVKGAGRSLLRLDYVPNEKKVEVGSRVLTSGQDLLFPKGVPVGRIVSVERGEYFQEIIVEPAAHLTGLEHVLVLAGPPDTFESAAQAAAAGRQPSE